eukprot:204893-Pyramimonas_sp.AAC.1
MIGCRVGCGRVTKGGNRGPLDETRGAALPAAVSVGGSVEGAAAAGGGQRRQVADPMYRLHQEGEVHACGQRAAADGLPREHCVPNKPLRTTM